MNNAPASSTPKILVCGSVNMDLVVRLDELPFEGQTKSAHRLDYVSGGKGANQAVAVARLGGKVGMLAAVGSDGFGTTLRANLDQEGIDLEWLATKPGPSGLAVIAVDDEAKNFIMVVPGANGLLTPDDADLAESAIAQADLVMLQLEIPIKTVLHVVRLCRVHNVPVVLNPAPVPNSKTELFPQELFDVDLICPNQSETAALLNIQAPKDIESAFDAARALLDKGARHVVITLGELGAVAATRMPDGKRIVQAIDAHRVDAVDTVAAGDAFIGALAFQIAQGSGLMEACLFASAAAAHAVTVHGAQPSLPNLEQVNLRLPRDRD